MNLPEQSYHGGVDPSWGPVTEDRLTRDITIVQRRDGHRFSSDDMVTAFVACRQAPGATRVLDMGCGIGSVLLHLAWSLPHTTLVGIEAQAISFALLRENVRRNGLEGRITTHHGDLREPTHALGGPFDLITGTPPYFPPDTAREALDSQRAYARIEYRGGIDDYARAGARWLAPGGTLVLCGDARTEPRLERAATEVGLVVVARTAVVAHAPKPPLFAVWTLRAPAASDAGARVDEVLTLREAGGVTTADAARLRAFSGF